MVVVVEVEDTKPIPLLLLPHRHIRLQLVLEVWVLLMVLITGQTGQIPSLIVLQQMVEEVVARERRAEQMDQMAVLVEGRADTTLGRQLVELEVKDLQEETELLGLTLQLEVEELQQLVGPQVVEMLIVEEMEVLDLLTVLVVLL